MTTWWTKGCAVAGVLVVVTTGPATAQIAVFDATSYAGIVQQISQGLQEISTLEQQLQSDEHMLQSLPASSLGGFLPVVSQTAGLIGQIQGIEQSSSALLTNLNQVYPTSFTGQTPTQILTSIASMESQNRLALTTAMQIKAQIAQNQPTISNSITTAETASAGAVGPTQAIQATNQLVGNLGSQLTEQNALLASASQAQEQAALLSNSKDAATEQFLAPTNLPLSGQGVGY